MTTIIDKVKNGEQPIAIGDVYDRKTPSHVDKVVLEAASYFQETFQYPDIAKKIIRAFNYWIQAPEDKFEQNHELWEIWNTSQLLFLDICFDKRQRQGKPTAHIKCGIPRVLNSFIFNRFGSTWVEKENYVQALEIGNQVTLKQCKIINVLLSTQGTRDCPTEELYYEMCGSRSTLCSLQEEINSLQEFYGTKNEKFVELSDKIKRFLVIIDDCRRIAQNIGDDITEGYYSFPIIYAINEGISDNECIQYIISQCTKDPLLINTALLEIQESGCFDHAKETLHALRNEILEQYKNFDKNPLMGQFFEEFLNVPDDFGCVKWELS